MSCDFDIIVKNNKNYNFTIENDDSYVFDVNNAVNYYFKVFTCDDVTVSMYFNFENSDRLILENGDNLIFE